MSFENLLPMLLFHDFNSCIFLCGITDGMLAKCRCVICILPDILQAVAEDTSAGCTQPLPAGPACRRAVEARVAQSHSMGSAWTSCT